MCCEAAETRRCFTGAKTGWGRKQSLVKKYTGLPWLLSGKESTCNAGDLGSTPGSGRTPGEGNGYLLQYSCLDNSIDRGAWWATIHGVTKSWMTERLTLSLTRSTQWNQRHRPQEQQLNIKQHFINLKVRIKKKNNFKLKLTSTGNYWYIQYIVYTIQSIDISRPEYWSG